MAAQSNLQPNNEQNRFRPLSRASPTLWDYHSFTSFQFSNSEYESCTRKVELLREQIHDMLMASTENIIDNVKFINLLCRIGVSYHFEREIEEQLDHVFNALPTILQDINDYDLHITSLLFTVLRQHGYKMSYEVFKRFKNKDGKFKTDISNDFRGVLGLYEASFLRVHEEDILEEALAFTRPLLESLANSESISPHYGHYIKHALDLPFHKGIPRVEAREYIDFYEKDESPSPILLEFAKLDFNRLQLLHKKELCEIVRWWEDSELAKKLPYARDRIVEVYFWACGTLFQPQYSISRIISSKYVTMISLCDDTYDLYATLDEAKAFTDASKRFTIDAISQLPDYMKDLYKAMLDLFEETETLSKQAKTYVHYAKEAFKELLRSYQVEKEWGKEGHVPTVCEYIKNGYATSTYGVTTVACLIGMEDIADINHFQWLSANPLIFKALKLIGRLLNDLVTHQEEQNWGDCASAVECYMKEYNVSRQKAVNELLKMCSDAWKDINEECIKPTIVSRPILEVLVNLARTTELVYRFDDAYTHASSLKAKVTSLFIHPISMS